jgi:hypothetical protein
MQSEGKPMRVLAAESVDPGSLRIARAVLGLVGLLTVARMWWYGWVHSLYAGPSHRFTYLGFGWVPQPSEPVVWGIVAMLAAGSLLLVGDRRPRLGAGLVAGSLGWIELIDATTYLNHYWAMTLVAALLALARPTRGWIWLLRFQVGLVYVFAGLAKLQADWLVHALPLRLWLPARADLPVIGHLLTFDSTAHVLSIVGAVFDCAVVPLLLWRRTRLLAWCGLLVFHVATWSLFPIGVFPWLMTGLATVFFAPDWPTKFRNLRVLVAAHRDQHPQVATGSGRRVTGSALAAAGLWCAVQLFLPLRAHLYPGDSRWTTEGYQFAWNVLLTERAGTVTFNVTDPATGRRWTADASRLYTSTQLRVMQQDPDLIQQAAKAIATDEGGHVEVRVDAWLSLNGRPAARAIDPTVDLAAEPRTIWHRRWVLPEPKP